MRHVLLVLMAMVSLSACSFIELTPEGEKVRVLTMDEVSKCQRKGQTTVSVLAKVAGGDRFPEDIQEELKLLARNSAVDLQGDTVVAITPVAGGRQTFAVFRCMPQ